jgi:hypothetical protein
MKKEFKGWCLPENKDVAVCFVNGKMFARVFKSKGRKSDYHPDCWPPNRVTVTVEVEDYREKN